MRIREALRGAGWLAAAAFATLSQSALAVSDAAPEVAPRASFEVLHSFDGSDGALPTSSLVLGSDGNIHGVAGFGGAEDQGTSFRMTPRGRFTLVRDFVRNRGVLRPWGLIQGSDGDYHGVSSGGGAFHDGTAYRMSSRGEVTLLHSFAYQALEGAFPISTLLEASDGYFYGTTGSAKGTSQGAIFKVSPNGAFEVLHVFRDRRDNGVGPGQMRLTQASDGHLYGVTAGGGRFGHGTAYRLTLDGTFSVLHSFDAADKGGFAPCSALVQAADGHLHGLTSGGGAHGGGTFFRLDTQGHFEVLHHFAQPVTYSGVNGDLLLARDGNFYGVARISGKAEMGSVFRLTPEGVYTRLHSFGPDPAKGRSPSAGLIEVGDGDFYGTTAQGGAFDKGTLFRLRLK